MRLLFTIKGLQYNAGGAERVFVDVVNALCSRHEIHVASYDTADATSFYSLDNRIVWHRLNIGSTVNKTNFFETFQRMMALRRLGLALNPDVAVGFMHSLFIPMGFALTGTSIPVVGSEHIVPDHYKGRPLQSFLLLLSSFFIKTFTVVSSNVKALYPSFLRRKMIVISNPLTPPIPSDVPRQKIILSVGRLEPQKDQATLIAAFAIIADRFPDWTVQIIGKGALYPDLVHQIAMSSMQDRVHLLSETKTIAHHYHSASLFVLPSLYESFGLALAEALSHGTPAIGFADCEGVNTLIKDGHNGLLVTDRDRVQGLASALEKALSSPDERAYWSGNAREILGQYDVETVATQWEALLQAVKNP